MDFWSSNAFDGSRFEWTHVAPGFVQLSFSSLVPTIQVPEVPWAASQELYEPRLNTTIGAGQAVLVAVERCCEFAIVWSEGSAVNRLSRSRAARRWRLRRSSTPRPT